MRHALAVLAAAVLLGLPSQARAQATKSVEPFNLATVDIAGREAVALVLREQIVVELDGANRNLEMTGNYPVVAVPDNMVDLIGQYEYGLKHRIYEIVNHVVGQGTAHGHHAAGLRPQRERRPFPRAAPVSGQDAERRGQLLQPLLRGVHPRGAGRPARKRMAERGVPYLFYKTTRGGIIGHNDEVVLPHGRDRTDWEVELGIVIGRTARYVPAAEARNYVFGYTIHNDVSDRGGRPPGGFGQGSDWLVGKGAETFAPLGPWIVPAEFYGDPTKRLHMKLFIDGKLVQEAKIEDMIHNVWELIEYASSIVTLHPGDVINGGTTSGTSTGAVLRRDPLGLPEAGRGDGGEDRRDRDAAQPGRRRPGAREGQRRAAPAGRQLSETDARLRPRSRARGRDSSGHGARSVAIGRRSRTSTPAAHRTARPALSCQAPSSFPWRRLNSTIEPTTSFSSVDLSRSASCLKYRQDLPILCLPSLDSRDLCPSASGSR